MATLNEYFDNCHWRAMYNFSTNQKVHGKYCINPSPGQSSLPVLSNGTAGIYFTRGRVSRFPYKGTDIGLNPQEQHEVRQCVANEGNVYGCIQQFRQNRNSKC